MTKFVYVILHYKNLEDTIECIESIQSKTSSPIVIVDNHTLTKTEEKQLRNYTSDLILLDHNYGFAKANNRGIDYANSKYDPDFVVVLNNDIVITQVDFEKRIMNTYKVTSFDMLGPKILTNGGDSVNPFPVYKTIEEVEQAIGIAKRNITLFSSKIKTFCFQIYHSIKYKIKKVPHLENGLKKSTDVALHGCAIIFSKKYLQHYKEAFYNDTFLYHEEEFLYYRVQKDNLISCYDPTITCFHKEGSSLNHHFQKQNRQKELFRNQEILKSLEKLLRIMKEDTKI